MLVSVVSTGARPCQVLHKRVVSSRAYGSATNDSAPGLLPASVAPPPPEVGKRLREWLASPFDFAAFGPRLAVGALLSAPEKIQTLQQEIEKANETLSSPAPAEDKGKLLAAQIETLTTEALEKGASLEADFLHQLKAYLPEGIAASITTPKTPVSKAKATASTQGPVVTELPDDLELN